MARRTVEPRVIRPDSLSFDTWQAVLVCMLPFLVGMSSALKETMSAEALSNLLVRLPCLRGYDGVGTYHRCDSIRLIHIAIIFRRSLTV